MARDGDRLLAVRHRHDEAKRRRYETVELIVDEVPREPREKSAPGRYRRGYNDLVGVRVPWHEHDTRRRLKETCAIWRPQQRLWEVNDATAVVLDLVDRIESGWKWVEARSG